MIGDWIGLAVLLLFVGGALVGVKLLSRQRVSTEEEFEKRLSESATMLGAGVSAIDGMLNPSAAKGKAAVRELKQGRYQKKRKEGKSLGREKKERNDG